MRHLFTPKRLACALLTLSSASLLHAAELNTAKPVIAAQARNVILIIGDGMDSHQISSARSYLVGSRADMLLDTLPVRSAVQVLTVDEHNPERPVYVADSANSATSMASGEITSRGRIGTSAGSDRDITNIVELAQAQGFAAGIVTTANITDATPASFVAHTASRGCENPNIMRSNEASFYPPKPDCDADRKPTGAGSIAQQIVEGSIDIILGGGYQHLAATAEGTETTTVAEDGTAEGTGLITLAQNNDFDVVLDVEKLNDLDPNKKIIGVFTDSTMPTRWQGTDGRIAEKVETSLLNKVYVMLGSATLPEPMSCEANPEYADTPSLQSMTAAAIKHLDSRKGDKGFFLMVESASIDKQSHKRNPCGSIGELEQLNEALKIALDYAAKTPNTLILVTADHGQAAQIIPDESLFVKVGIPAYTPGYVARLKTPEGSILAINYATTVFPAEEHTGTDVPLFANEVGLGLVPPRITQPKLFNLMADYLQLDYPKAGH